MDKPAAQAPARKWSALLYVAALLPFVCALFAHAGQPEPQAPRQTGEPAGLIFEQYLVDLGDVPPVPVLEGRFRFTNRSDRTITIKDLKPSCGCLNPRLEKREYQPGESGEFFVRVETAGEKAGQKAYTVDVSYEDSQPRQVQLGFDFILPERKVVVNPRGLIFYQLGTGATTRDVVVTDYRGEPLRVTEWACKSPYVTASIGPARTTAFGHYETRVTVTVAGGIPPGRHEALLNLQTDDPTFPLLRVPLWIEGPEAGIRQAGGTKEGDAAK